MLGKNVNKYLAQLLLNNPHMSKSCKQAPQCSDNILKYYIEADELGKWLWGWGPQDGRGALHLHKWSVSLRDWLTDRQTGGRRIPAGFCAGIFGTWSCPTVVGCTCY